MLEFKRDATGLPRLIEINPRFWGSLELAIRCGVDFPRLYVAACLGQPFDPVLTYAIGRRHVLPLAPDRARPDHRAGRLALLSELGHPHRFDTALGRPPATLLDLRATWWEIRRLRRAARPRDERHPGVGDGRLGQGRALAAVRSPWGRAGVEVDVLASGRVGHIARLALSPRRVHRAVHPRRRRLACLLLARVQARRDHALLLNGQSSADNVAEHHRVACPSARAHHVAGFEQYRIARDKGLTVRLAERLGVPAPRRIFPRPDVRAPCCRVRCVTSVTRSW